MNSKDENNMIGTGSELIKKLEEENRVSPINSLENLQTNLLDFFSNLMKETSSKESLKRQIEDSFMDDLQQTGPEALTFQQKLNLYKTISTQANISAESIVSLFKPTPGAASPLLDMTKKEEQSKDDDMYDSLSSEDLQNIRSFMAMISSMNKDKEEE